MPYPYVEESYVRQITHLYRMANSDTFITNILLYYTYEI